MPQPASLPQPCYLSTSPLFSLVERSHVMCPKICVTCHILSNFINTKLKLKLFFLMCIDSFKLIIGWPITERCVVTSYVPYCLTPSLPFSPGLFLLLVPSFCTLSALSFPLFACPRISQFSLLSLCFFPLFYYFVYNLYCEVILQVCRGFLEKCHLSNPCIQKKKVLFVFSIYCVRLWKQEWEWGVHLKGWKCRRLSITWGDCRKIPERCWRKAWTAGQSGRKAAEKPWGESWKRKERLGASYSQGEKTQHRRARPEGEGEGSGEKLQPKLQLHHHRGGSHGNQGPQMWRMWKMLHTEFKPYSP